MPYHVYDEDMPSIDMDPGVDGRGVPTETWEGLTSRGAAAIAVGDLWERVPAKRQQQLGLRPSLRQLARSALAYEVCPSLLEALSLADPKGAQHLIDLAQEERDRYA